MSGAQRNVYFHVGRFGHPYFDEQLKAAPPGFAYRRADAGTPPGTGQPRRIALHGGPMPALRGALERSAIRGLSLAGHVRRRRVHAPPDCALVHSAQVLLRSPERPYVLDCECVEVFTLYQRAALRRPWARARLRAWLADERCRFLLPWSDAARRGVEAALGADAHEVLAKTVTVLPAVEPRAEHPAERSPGPLRVLFIGTAFEAKGGVEAIRALARARESHDVVLDLVSDVPARWRAELERGEGVTAAPWPAPAQRMRELFGRADVLLFPSHMDTLGFVMLEAMAHGLPVLATEHFAVGELVHDGISGVVVEGENLLYGSDGLCRFDHTLPPPASFRRALAAPSEAYVERLARALATLAEDRDLHARLAHGAFAAVTEGHLSMERRRSALGRIYADALAR